MRNTFINTLCDLAGEAENVFLLCGDLGYSVLEPFATKFPSRFLNVGIAEQNMIAVASGLSREGYNVFCYSIGNFPTLRCMEQIRYDVCYHNANVKVVAVGAGYAYGPLGVSHHTTEDIAMLRTLPGMLLCSPADAIEARLAADFMVRRDGPGYVRINKSGEPNVHPSAPHEFLPGKLLWVKEGEDVLALSTGAITHSIYMELGRSHSDWALASVPFIGNYDSALLVDLAKQFNQIVTVEEHQLNGGFGGLICKRATASYAEAAAFGYPERLYR